MVSEVLCPCGKHLHARASREDHERWRRGALVPASCCSRAVVATIVLSFDHPNLLEGGSSFQCLPLSRGKPMRWCRMALLGLWGDFLLTNVPYWQTEARNRVSGSCKRNRVRVRVREGRKCRSNAHAKRSMISGKGSRSHTSSYTYSHT